jgi:hypothetical protein
LGICLSLQEKVLVIVSSMNLALPSQVGLWGGGSMFCIQLLSLFLVSPSIRFFVIRTTDSLLCGLYNRPLTTLSTLLQRPTTCLEAQSTYP